MQCAVKKKTTFHPFCATPSFSCLNCLHTSMVKTGVPRGFNRSACLWEYFLKCNIACWSHLYIDYYYILFVRIFTEHNPESGMSWYFSNNLHTCILTMNITCL